MASSPLLVNYRQYPCFSFLLMGATHYRPESYGCTKRSRVSQNKGIRCSVDYDYSRRPFRKATAGIQLSRMASIFSLPAAMSKLFWPWAFCRRGLAPALIR